MWRSCRRVGVGAFPFLRLVRIQHQTDPVFLCLLLSALHEISDTMGGTCSKEAADAAIVENQAVKVRLVESQVICYVFLFWFLVVVL
jgi:hypothetical protein